MDGRLAPEDRFPTIIVEQTSARGQDFMQSGMAGLFSSGQHGMSAIASSSATWPANSIAMSAIGDDDPMAAATAVTLTGPIRTESMANAHRMR